MKVFIPNLCCLDSQCLQGIEIKYPTISLRCAGVEHRDVGWRLRWRSYGLILIDQEWWRTSVGSWLMDRSSWVTSHGGWHLGHALTRGCGRAGHVAGTIEVWRDRCLGCGGCARIAILMAVSVVEPQNHPTLLKVA
jgi:hypothetical protein